MLEFKTIHTKIHTSLRARLLCTALLARGKKLFVQRTLKVAAIDNLKDSMTLALCLRSFGHGMTF